MVLFRIYLSPCLLDDTDGIKIISLYAKVQFCLVKIQHFSTKVLVSWAECSIILFLQLRTGLEGLADKCVIGS